MVGTAEMGNVCSASRYEINYLTHTDRGREQYAEGAGTQKLIPHLQLTPHGAVAGPFLLWASTAHLLNEHVVLMLGGGCRPISSR